MNEVIPAWGREEQEYICVIATVKVQIILARIQVFLRSKHVDVQYHWVHDSLDLSKATATWKNPY